MCCALLAPGKECKTFNVKKIIHESVSTAVLVDLQKAALILIALQEGTSSKEGTSNKPSDKSCTDKLILQRMQDSLQYKIKLTA